MLGATWPGVVFPGHRKQYKFGEDYFDMKKFFDANYNQFEIFVYTNLNKDDLTWMEEYELWQHAIASKIVRKRSQFNPDAWYNQTISGLPFVCLFLYCDRSCTLVRINLIRSIRSWIL